MSDDPETARQIAELARDARPLLVLDVDDVVLDFIGAFPKYVATLGLDLRLDTFSLHGNVLDPQTGLPVANDRVDDMIDAFFVAQADWQTVLAGAADAMRALAGKVEIVLLTAMPHRYRAARRAHLDALGLPYPLLTTEQPKGPALRQLRGAAGRPVAFVDDQPRNLASVRQAVADAHLFHLMADNTFRHMLPSPPDGAIVVDDWAEAKPRIAAALGV